MTVEHARSSCLQGPEAPSTGLKTKKQRGSHGEAGQVIRARRYFLILETSTLFLTLSLQHLRSLIQDCKSPAQGTTFNHRLTLALTSSRRCPFQKKASNYGTSPLTQNKPRAGSLSSILRVSLRNTASRKGVSAVPRAQRGSGFPNSISKVQSGSPSAIQRRSDTNFLPRGSIYSPFLIGLLSDPKAIEVLILPALLCWSQFTPESRFYWLNLMLHAAADYRCPTAANADPRSQSP